MLDIYFQCYRQGEEIHIKLSGKSEVEISTGNLRIIKRKRHPMTSLCKHKGEDDVHLPSTRNLSA
jgi:hypothetical protein